MVEKTLGKGGMHMSLILRFAEIMQQAQEQYGKLQSGDFTVTEEHGKSDNILAKGDNAAFMKFLLENGHKGSIRQIYIDPPFFSKANYDAVIKLQGGEGETAIKHMAYEDVWKQGMEEYLKMLCLRLMLMKDLLADDGTIWVHLDWHGVHYVKILMDEIFGEKHFINEIIWTYKSGGSSKKHFARKHDTILVYGKSDKYYINLPKEKSYNRGFKPYRFKGVEEFEDELGWYTMVNMKDVWNIDMVGRTSAERTGYATQKPEALLERIICAGSREGDICADFFCGSSTLGAVAGRLGRRWICCDNGMLAVSAGVKRLTKAELPMKVIFERESGKPLAKTSPVLDAYIWKTLFADKIDLKIKLREYRLDEIDTVKKKDTRKVLSERQVENSLLLVDYWSIDYNYDGCIFRPDRSFYREKSGLCCELSEEMDIENFENRKIMVKIADVLGNVSFCLINGGDLIEKA